MTPFLASSQYRAALAEAMMEEELAEQAAAIAKAHGVWRYHTLRSKGSASGFPDETYVGTRILFRELKRVGEVPTDRPVLVVCHSGMRSARATDALRGVGVDARNVVGGMLAWRDAGGTVVADDGHPGASVD